MPWRQTEQLHQLGGTQAGPALRRNFQVIDEHCESAKQLYAKVQGGSRCGAEV
jgi:hypothetical protein